MHYQQLLTAVSQHLADARPLIPMYIHLIVSALFPIYTGAHASLSRPSSAAKPTKKEKVQREDDDDDDEEDVVQKMEGLSPRDAIVFPVTAGIVLAGLYYLIKRYGADLINFIMGWYFSGVGVYSVAKLVNDGLGMLVSFVLPTYFGYKRKLWRADQENRQSVEQEDTANVSKSPLPVATIFSHNGFYDTVWSLRAAVKQRYIAKAYIHDIVDIKMKLTLINVLAAVIGVGSIAYANLVAKPWYLTNLQGFAVCYSALQIMSPTTFATGSLILGGLFCYDIWAVFFTPLMVTVAKNLDQPIKLVFPRPEEPSATPGEPPTRSYSMLGLGDIVLPGLMIGLALRFDLYLFYLKKQQMRKGNKKNVEGSDKPIVEVEKALYVPVTGNWGDRFWTSRLPTSAKLEKLSSSFPKPYFIASMVGYVVGMLATLGVMSVFQHAQPALLYLVPGVLIGLWGTGLVRGELSEMWEFSEAITGEQLPEHEKKEADRKDEAVKDGSFFGRLWGELFGDSEDELSKKDDDSKVSKDKKSPDAAANSKEAKPKTLDSDILISFSVTRYNPHTSSAASDRLSSQSSKASEEAPSSADSNQTSSDSGLEDTVLVGTDER